MLGIEFFGFLEVRWKGLLEGKREIKNIKEKEKFWESWVKMSRVIRVVEISVSLKLERIK